MVFTIKPKKPNVVEFLLQRCEIIVMCSVEQKLAYIYILYANKTPMLLMLYTYKYV